MERKIVVGLDIGTTKICAIVGETNEYGKINILGIGKYASTGVRRGVVANIKETTFAINEAIKAASNICSVDIDTVYVGIAGQHISSHRHKIPKIRSNPRSPEIDEQDVKDLENDARRLILEPQSEILHIIPLSYSVDKETDIREPIGHQGVKLEGDFHIITGAVNAIRDINTCVTRAGLKAEKIILEPIASSKAVLTQEELESGVVLIDIGGGTTDVAIFHNGVLKHTAVIPFGGDSITTDIETGCNILKKQAELVKINAGRAISNDADVNKIISLKGVNGRAPKEIRISVLSGIIQARMEEILKYVKHQIHISGLEKQLNAGVVVTGGGSQLKDITQLIEYKLRMDCKLGYPNQHLSEGMVDEVKLPTFATSVGLLMIGLESENNATQNEVRKNEQDTGQVIPGSKTVQPDLIKEEPKTGKFKEIFNKIQNDLKNAFTNPDLNDFN